MGLQSRARKDRRESTRRFAKAIKNGWVMPTPPEQMKRAASPLPLIALALWGLVATVAVAGVRFGWFDWMPRR